MGKMTVKGDTHPCSNCGKPARATTGDYQYSESGLNNLVLVCAELLACDYCGNLDVVISRMDELHRAIARAVAAKPYRLDGDEIRFLRKSLGMTADEIGAIMHVDKSVISRWENGKDVMGMQSDMLLRLIVMGLTVDDSLTPVN